MIEGKTKIITEGPEAGTILMKTKDVLTAGDAASYAEINKIGIEKTKQAALIFSFLNKNGIDTAFYKQVDDTTLLCDECTMLPIEFVIRRYAWGSYLKRNPEYKPNDTLPYRFETPLFELFHKHTAIKIDGLTEGDLIDETIARQKYLQNGEWADGVYTDPMIITKPGHWEIHPPKAPLKNDYLFSIDPILSTGELLGIKNELLFPTFLALEKALSEVKTTRGPIHLADIKFEIGFREKDQKLVLADVIDNDSWRIWPGGNPKYQLDKQSFRDGEDLSIVQNKYSIVTKILEKF